MSITFPLITQTLGWIGTFLIVYAYFLVSFDKIKINDARYQLINLAGALTLGVHVVYQKAWAAVTLEIIWGLIAVASLFKSKNSSKK
jgi:hypothetical protein